MPEISLFYGIRVTMYYDDHNPPHFHAEYDKNKVIIEYRRSTSIKRGFSIKAAKINLGMVRSASR